MNYTYEPWRVEGRTVWAEEFRICQLDSAGSNKGDIAHANARRIVACVNACAGIPTEELESGTIRALDAVYHALGWQGGTIHQVVRRIESLMKLEAAVGSEALAKLEGE